MSLLAAILKALSEQLREPVSHFSQISMFALRFNPCSIISVVNRLVKEERELQSTCCIKPQRTACQLAKRQRQHGFFILTSATMPSRHSPFKMTGVTFKASVCSARSLQLLLSSPGCNVSRWHRSFSPVNHTRWQTCQVRRDTSPSRCSDWHNNGCAHGSHRY